MSWSGWEDAVPTKDKKKEWTDPKRRGSSNTWKEGSSNDWTKKGTASWEKNVPYSDEWKKKNWDQDRRDMTPDGKNPGRARWVDRKDSWCKNFQAGRCRYPAEMCNRAHTQEEFDAACARFAKKK